MILRVLNGYYVTELMQRAILDDEMCGYYNKKKYETAIAKESTFGTDLELAKFDYYSEKELQDLGYKDTPDNYLKKLLIVYLNDVRYEITWIDFKYYYCSCAQWAIDPLRFQASRCIYIFFRFC